MYRPRSRVIFGRGTGSQGSLRLSSSGCRSPRPGFGCRMFVWYRGSGLWSRSSVRRHWLSLKILSPEDRVSTMWTRIADYLAFGVPHVWLIDPQGRRAFVYSAEGSVESKDLILRTSNPEIVLPLTEIFAALE